MGEVSSSTRAVSLSDDLEAAYHLWQPATAPRAGILLLHGLGEHAGRYEPLGRYLAGRSCLVVGGDARGHGRSSGKRGHVLRFDQYVDDAEELMCHIRKQEPAVKDWFIVGHSMGGLIALRLALKHPDRYRGIIVSNPLLGLSIKVPFLKGLIGKLVSSFVPSLTMDNEIDPAHLSRDPRVGKAYEADPLVHHRVSARWFTEMLEAMSDTHVEAVNGLEMPVLFLLSTADRLTDHASSRMLFERLSTNDKMLKVYDGLYHEIFNEYERETVFADLSDWLDQQLRAQPINA